jgi:sulfatase maturation enzyme AslB (radical SAM superfamily)
MSTANNFCIYPFVHSLVKTTGEFRPCCVSEGSTGYNIKNDTITDWWNSDYMQTLRTQFLNNERPGSCSACWQNEDCGATSLRLKVNDEYQIYSKKYIGQMLETFDWPGDQPVNMEFALTNLCNLSCMMCTETSSSQILLENKKLKISNYLQNDYTSINENTINKIKEWLLTKPKLISLRGGETTIVPEIKDLLEWAIDNNLTSDTKVQLTTNATQFDQEWKEIIEQFDSPRIMISIDGVGAVNDYIRHGSSWNQIQKSINTIKSVKNVTVYCNTVVQNLNLLDLGNIVDWAKQQNIFLGLDILHYPSEFSLNNLPVEIKQLAIEKMQGYTELTSIVNAITLDDPENWHEFFNLVNLKDSHRKVNILDVIPELTEHWNAKNQ